MNYFRPDPQNEIGLCYKPETPKANPELYDIISCRGKSFVDYAGVTPLMLMLWATNLGYEIVIDDDGEIKLWTRNSKPQLDYFCVLQHEDFMNDYPRDSIERESKIWWDDYNAPLFGRAFLKKILKAARWM